MKNSKLFLFAATLLMAAIVTGSCNQKPETQTEGVSADSTKVLSNQHLITIIVSDRANPPMPIQGASVSLSPCSGMDPLTTDSNGKVIFEIYTEDEECPCLSEHATIIHGESNCNTTVKIEENCNNTFHVSCP